MKKGYRYSNTVSFSNYRQLAKFDSTAKFNLAEDAVEGVANVAQGNAKKPGFLQNIAQNAQNVGQKIHGAVTNAGEGINKAIGGIEPTDGENALTGYGALGIGAGVGYGGYRLAGGGNQSNQTQPMNPSNVNTTQPTQNGFSNSRKTAKFNIQEDKENTTQNKLDNYRGKEDNTSDSKKHKTDGITNTSNMKTGDINVATNALANKGSGMRNKDMTCGYRVACSSISPESKNYMDVGN